jgi:hypothetical protein
MSFHCVKRRQARALASTFKQMGIARKIGRPSGPSTPTLLKRRRKYVEKKESQIMSQQLSQDSQSTLLRVLGTQSGRKLFPQLCQALQPDPAKQTLVDSAVDLVNNVARAAKPDLVRLLGRKLKPRDVATLFSMPIKTVQNIFARKRSSSTTSPFEQAYPSYVTRAKQDPNEAEICVKYFLSRCASSTSSSRESPTLQLKVTYQVMEEEFYAEFPRLIQEACRLDPTLLAQARQASTPTRFQKSVLAVAELKFGSHPERLAFARKKYRLKLKQCAKKLLDVTRVKPAQKDQQEWDNEVVNFVLDADDLENEVDQVRPLCQRAFLQVIQDAGIKYTTTFHPHECPIHSQGRQVSEAALAKAQEGERKILKTILDQEHAHGEKGLTQLQETQDKSATML